MFRSRRKFSSSNKSNISANGLSTSLEESINTFKSIFKDDETIIYRYFENRENSKIKCCMVFVNAMIKKEILNDNIIEPIMNLSGLDIENNIIEVLKNKVIASNDITYGADIDSLVEAVINGDAVIILDGEAKGLIISSGDWKTRAIEEPQAEKVLRGPREGFTESIMDNISMIRRKLKTNDLKFKFKTIGVQTKTKACICYIEGIINEKILQELYKRLDEIDIDGALDTGYIQELIKDSPFSPFKTIGNTERPDVLAGKMLEGRIGLILDGTPVVLTMPFIFIEYFQAPDDYYNNFVYSSITRIIRMISFVLTVSVPGIYLALITFHQEMIPTDLLLSISAAQQGTPFPSVIEALGLLLVFEILRETGQRTPSYIGQALSIVGALVLGTAAVDARFVSAPMVIIVALSGITGLMTPKIKGVVILFRILLLALSAFMGLYGFVFGIMGIIIHLFNIRSFGVIYMSGTDVTSFKDIKDTGIRIPWFYMTYRPKYIAWKNVRRITNGGK